MLKTLLQISAGTAGFVGGSVADSLPTELVNNVTPALENPNNYVKGLVISGLIQIVLKLIDKWSEKRKIKKAENAT